MINKDANSKTTQIMTQEKYDPLASATTKPAYYSANSVSSIDGAPGQAKSPKPQEVYASSSFTMVEPASPSNLPISLPGSAKVTTTQGSGLPSTSDTADLRRKDGVPSTAAIPIQNPGEKSKKEMKKAEKELKKAKKAQTKKDKKNKKARAKKEKKEKKLEKKVSQKKAPKKQKQQKQQKDQIPPTPCRYAESWSR